jgi:hypothetical protein
MDRKKLQALREKVETISLPKAPSSKQGYYQSPTHDEAAQKALAAAATTATGLLNKALPKPPC